MHHTTDMSYIQKLSVHLLTVRHKLYNSEAWHSAIWNEHALADAAFNKLYYYVASFSYNTHLCWVKRDQLDATCFIITLFSAQHVSDVKTSILRSLRLIRWVISWVVLLWFDVCWCYVVVWLWWCGIRMQVEACIRIPHHHSHTATQHQHTSN